MNKSFSIIIARTRPGPNNPDWIPTTRERRNNLSLGYQAGYFMHRDLCLVKYCYGCSMAVTSAEELSPAAVVGVYGIPLSWIITTNQLIFMKSVYSNGCVACSLRIVINRRILGLPECPALHI